MTKIAYEELERKIGAMGYRIRPDYIYHAMVENNERKQMMNKLTYKDFEKMVNNMGCVTEVDDELNNLYVWWQGVLISRVHLSKPGVMSVYEAAVRACGESNTTIQDFVSHCHALCLTNPEDREEPKRYYLKLKPQFEYLLLHRELNYLNIEVRTNEVFLDDAYEVLTNGGQDKPFINIFTEDEINELAEKYDLSIFERVEVEDE